MARQRLPGTVSAPKSTLEAYPDYVQAIGMVSVEIANLEFRLGALLGAILHIDERLGEIVYLTPQSYSARLSILENVVPYTLQPRGKVTKQVEAIIKRSRAYIGQRHGLIHDSWGTSPNNSKVVVRRTVPYVEKNSAKPIKLGDLTDLIEKTRDLSEEVRVLAEQMYEEWPPYTSPHTLREPRPAVPSATILSPQKGQAFRPK